jgi:type III pantothenate kinase
MLLILDIGNSNLVFGLYAQEQWQHIWREETLMQRSAEEYALRLTNYCLENDIKLAEVSQVFVSSVVPALTPVLKQTFVGLLGKEPLVINGDLMARLPIHIAKPYEIGADLVANAVAGFAKAQTACIIVDFGTALTFTTVGKTGDILGVAIAPGLKTAIKSLFSNTAQLPEVPLEVPTSAIGKSTPHAIQAGILLGYEGLVAHLVGKIKTELNEPCQVFGTGGLVEQLPALQTVFDAVLPTLTLDGVRLIGWHFSTPPES